MKRTFLLCFLAINLIPAHAQKAETSGNSYLNAADKLLQSEGKLIIGGYGEVHYNQQLSSETGYNGSLDVHRMVMLLGYNFSSKTQFISEIEYEHVKEVYVEQAFLQHKINSFINLRAGLMLIPMGIINEYHEPTTFNGVERPLVDTRISPTTWREIGAGFSGHILPVSIKYQLYIVNGFSSYNSAATLSGKNGFRNGRQKGAESFVHTPNYTFKLEYYGIRGLNAGFSGYFGKTESSLHNGLDKSNQAAIARADSSVVGLNMIGLDARYTLGGLQLKGQYYYSGITNSSAYNRFTATNGKQNDLGSSMQGYYLEAGYNIFRHLEKTKYELVPFVRMENYDTHHATEGGLAKNKSYNNDVITTGLTWKLAKGAVVKADMQFVKSEAASSYSKILSAGIGVMF
jgi:hypothetical protein